MDTQELQRRMAYHPIKDDAQRELYEQNRAKFIDLARHVVEATPESREQSLALTALQEALMWTNAAIACNIR